MAISFDGKQVFCDVCGSYDMEFLEDGLFKAVANSETDTGVKCTRCGNLFSKEFVEVNLPLFTSDDNRQIIMDKRKAMSERYNRFDEERMKAELELAKEQYDKHAKKREKERLAGQQVKL